MPKISTSVRTYCYSMSIRDLKMVRVGFSEQRGFSFACSPHEMKHMLEVLSAEDVVLAVDAAVIDEEVKSSSPHPDDGEIGH